ncbi:MAG: hypothetical protein U0636_11285 [Phycisphaerales bacterium]
MKPFHLASSAALLSAIVLTSGCYSPQPTELYGSDDLPKKDWYTLPADSSEVQTLPPAYQRALADQREAVASEVGSKGAITPETQKNIAKMNEACNSAYLVSFDLVATNPTPGLNGQSETWDQRRINDSIIYSQNLRALADEWSRFWLMDMPMGTPYNTINTSGRF